MISAVVLTPDSWTSGDLAHERETVVRSLVWLVSAVVSSVVRDVTLAVPAGLGLGDLADQSGCGLVQAETEADRLAAAVRAAREGRLIVMKAGYQPEAGLIDELDLFMRRRPEDALAAVLSTPTSFLQRLFPQRASPVGCLVPKAFAERSAAGLDRLLQSAQRRGEALATRCRPIL